MIVFLHSIAFILNYMSLNLCLGTFLMSVVVAVIIEQYTPRIHFTHTQNVNFTHLHKNDTPVLFCTMRIMQK